MKTTVQQCAHYLFFLRQNPHVKMPRVMSYYEAELTRLTLERRKKRQRRKGRPLPGATIPDGI